MTQQDLLDKLEQIDSMTLEEEDQGMQIESQDLPKEEEQIPNENEEENQEPNENENPDQEEPESEEPEAPPGELPVTKLQMERLMKRIDLFLMLLHEIKKGMNANVDK